MKDSILEEYGRVNFRQGIAIGALFGILFTVGLICLLFWIL